MEPLSAAYVVTLAGQLGQVSAFLGGFAATSLTALLTLGHASRASTLAVVASAVASVSFIIDVVAATMLTAVLSPSAPHIVAASLNTGPARFMLAAFFDLGVLSLLFAIGASGWIRSKALGWTTTAVAAGGAVAVLALTVSV